jgi:hypothetical protein
MHGQQNIKKKIYSSVSFTTVWIFMEIFLFGILKLRHKGKGEYL